MHLFESGWRQPVEQRPPGAAAAQQPSQQHLLLLLTLATTAAATDIKGKTFQHTGKKGKKKRTKIRLN